MTPFAKYLSIAGKLMQSIFLSLLYLWSFGWSPNYHVPDSANKFPAFSASAKIFTAALNQTEPAKSSSRQPAFDGISRMECFGTSITSEKIIALQSASYIIFSVNILRQFRKLSPLFPFHFFW